MSLRKKPPSITAAVLGGVGHGAFRLASPAELAGESIRETEQVQCIGSQHGKTTLREFVVSNSPREFVEPNNELTLGKAIPELVLVLKGKGNPKTSILKVSKVNAIYTNDSGPRLELTMTNEGVLEGVLYVPQKDDAIMFYIKAGTGFARIVDTVFVDTVKQELLNRKELWMKFAVTARIPAVCID